MTVAPHAGGGAVAPYSDDEVVGLEDVGFGDVVIPRLQIVHDSAIFRDNLSKAEYPELDVILLGLVKQRIFWHEDVDEGDKPMCKSPDHEHGFPNVSDETPKDKRFPWAKSNFDPSDFEPDPEFNNLLTLPCQSCIFKEWDKGDWKVPPCTEQHTYPLLYNSSPDDPDGVWTPALLTVQKTGIKPSRQYISSFAQSKTPMFTVRTTIKLTQASRGSVKYSVPSFRKGEGTDRDAWGEYADQFRTIRSFIRQAPRRPDADEDAAYAEASSNENTGPASPAPAAAASPAAPEKPATAAPATPPAPATAAPGGDDDLPF